MVYFLNANQTSNERKKKYKMMIRAGFPIWKARQCRDWSLSHVKKFIKSNKKKYRKEKG